MRVSAMFVFVAAALLAPPFATADPAQPEPVNAAAPATAATSPNAASATNPGAAPGLAVAGATPHAGETVIVHGRTPDDDMLDRVVCRAEPPRTGSRLGGTRECHTVREWNDSQKASQASLENIQIRALSGGYGR